MCGHDTVSTCLFQTPAGFLVYSFALIDKLKEIKEAKKALELAPSPEAYFKAQELLEWLNNRLIELQEAEKEWLNRNTFGSK